MSGVAIVTGAGSGIGLASSLQLQEDGMTVIALDLNVEAAAKASPNALTLDVSNADQVAEVMAEILVRWPRIDVLVNNAGITGSAQATLAHKTPVEEFDRVMAVNVRGPFLCSSAVLPSMIEAGGGHIITIASVAGIVVFPGRCAYTTSKGAALQFARSLAVDYGGMGIRSNAICPGMVETPMTQWRLDQPDLRDRTESQIPMGRVASPQEIADVVSILASGRMGYANGAALVIDGGWTAL
jgi:NAD(P)-dependent dehydrogenase (short-subunit alcohol dehydrogenase family)